MKSIQTIAVVGATGMLGAPVTKELKRQGYSVSAVVRDNVNAQKKLGPEIFTHVADLKSVSSLRTAFQQADFVYVSLSTAPGEQNSNFKTEIEGVENIIKAAKLSGVKRIGYLSSLVKDYDEKEWWVFDAKRKACELLLNCDIPVTIFYPSNFFENLTELQLKGKRVMLAGKQETKSWWIGTNDYGRQVAEAFRQDHNENREYTIQGLEPFNMDEAADVFIENYSSEDLKKTTAPLWIFKLLKPFSKTMDFQYNILHAINNYDEQFQSEKAWRELGKPEETLADWASRQ